MERDKKNSRSDGSSLGILNMDSLIAFGELPSNANNRSRISERLKSERMMAYETLQKSRGNSIRQHSKGQTDAAAGNSKPNLDTTDYVPFRRPNTINISDLVVDESITLECSGTNASTTKDSVKISFEPAEITGRSTQLNYHYPLSRATNTTATSSRLSVCDILASSFAPKARNLARDTLFGDGRSSASTSTTMGYYASRSLPRTADMSRSKDNYSVYDLSLGSDVRGSAAHGLAKQPSNENDSAFGAEDFSPGELMESKLLLDEIEWAEQYAAIPTVALSTLAKAKMRANTSKHGGDVPPSPAKSNASWTNPEANISMGSFFNQRSEQLSNIVHCRSPDRSRTPIALFDEEPSVGIQTPGTLTPKIDNRTYSLIGTAGRPECRGDSGNASENSSSYLMTMSAIDRALCNLDVNGDDDSDAVIIERLMRRATTQLPHSRAAAESDIAAACVNAASDEEKSAEAAAEATLREEDKENVNPLSDTVSFHESMLNTSDFKHLRTRSSSETRSPLSPIELKNGMQIYTPTLTKPSINVSLADDPQQPQHVDAAAADGDIDEWPSTPIKPPQRRVCRSRSRSKSPLHAPRTPSPLPEKRSPRMRPAACNVANAVRSSKSLSSTRLDGGHIACADNDFAISPSNLTTSKSLMLGHGKDTPSPTRRYAVSPLCTPSPSHLDSTTNSERRYLSVGGGGGRHEATPSPASSVGSPGRSESGASKYNYGVAPVRTCSCSSIKSGVGGGTVAPSSSVGGGNGVSRSLSRSSNSSEFSHRDGKVIPLKVTTLELSWGSTKLRTVARKSMQVKNISSKRLVVRVQVHGPGFQAANSQGQGNTLTLQSLECRSIVVNFCPTVTGIAIGRLGFYAPHNVASTSSAASASANAYLEIPLYGYGGHASIAPQNILKGPVGAAFLPMGDLCELARPLERNVTIYNRGPLPAFAIVCIDSMGLHMPRLCDAFEAYPDRLLLAPGGTASVRLVFRPRRDDIKKIVRKIDHVLTVANMRIVCGDEANRQRMRRLVRRMPPQQLAKIAPANSLEKLWSTFPHEVEMRELRAYGEHPDVTFDLLSGMRVHEIALTLNHEALDETTNDSSLIFPDGDETVLFRTVYAGVSPTPSPLNALTPVDEELLETTQTSHAHGGGDGDAGGASSSLSASTSCTNAAWSVIPDSIEFDFVARRRTERVCFLVRNSSRSRQYFEIVCATSTVDCDGGDLFSFSPSKGYIEPNGGQVEIEVHTPHERPPERMPAKPIEINVYLENERIVLPVRVPDDNYARASYH